MRFKIDENLPDDLAYALRAAGWDCQTVAEEHLGGADDSTIEQVCRAESRILVTFDRGFADIRLFAPETHPGFIVFRLRDQSKPRVLEIADRVIEWLSQRDLRNELWIVDEDRIRIRGGEGVPTPSSSFDSLTSHPLRMISFSISSCRLYTPNTPVR